MIGSSHGSPQSVPSLSHREAEGLISARLDAPLSSRQDQALASHLMGCTTCRAFAESMSTMSVGFREIPRLPASPTVSRQVRERINQPRSFWDRFAGAAGGKGSIASLGAAAAMLIIVYAAWSNLNGGDNGNSADRTIAAAAAQASEVALNSQSPTQLAATNTIVPGTLLTPTDTDPTIPNITAPDETATLEATATEEDTVTTAEDNTNTPEPTSTRKPDPTATDKPQPTATDEPTETLEPTATETLEPTSTEVPEATATEEETATEVPTETEEPKPTKTPKPKATATAEDTATDVPEDTATPTEEPVGQPTIGGVDDGEVPTEEATESQIDETQPVDDPTEAPTEEPTDEATEDNGGSVIEPINTPAEEEPTAENTEDVGGDTQEDTPVATEDDSDGGSGGILDNTQRVAGLGDNTEGAPQGPLMMNKPQTLMVTSADLGGSLLQITATSDGTVIQGLGAAACPIWSPMGIVLLYQDQSSNSPQAAIYDAETQQYGAISNPNDESYVEEIPVGWSGSAAYYLRLLGDSDSTAVLYGYDVNSGGTSELWRGTNIEMSGGCGVVTENGFLIPTVDSWLQIDFGGSASEIDSMTFPVTGQPIASPFGSLVMYPSGTQLVIASASSPGTASGSLMPYAPNAGSGYTWEPTGDYVAVSDGASITIYDYMGNLLGTLGSETGITIAGPQWIEGGIYYLETSPNPSLRIIIPQKIPGYSQ